MRAAPGSDSAKVVVKITEPLQEPSRICTRIADALARVSELAKVS